MEASEQRESLRGRTIAFFGEFAYWPGYHYCSPVELAKRSGAVLWESVDVGLDFLVIGEKRGKGKAQALRKAEIVQKVTSSSGRTLQVLSEAEYRELVRIDLTGKSFYFAGGFDCCPKEMGDDLLGGMVSAVGGTVAPVVHTLLDYLVLGNRRGKGKTEAERKGLELVQAGWGLTILNETSFLELIRRDTPVEAAAGGDTFASMVGSFYGLINEKKVQRALKMLQTESFQLYSRVGLDNLCGIVKSQTQVDTVYAPWIRGNGQYGCYSQDLSECMGLQGSVCKHLLVLLLGLVRSGELDQAKAMLWMQAAASKKPKLDDELSTDALLHYRGAVAGEVDWRPTETVPEDFYF